MRWSRVSAGKPEGIGIVIACWGQEGPYAVAEKLVSYNKIGWGSRNRRLPVLDQETYISHLEQWLLTTHGGRANGIPSHLFTEPDVIPVTVAVSKVTVGAACLYRKPKYAHKIARIWCKNSIMVLERVYGMNSSLKPIYLYTAICWACFRDLKVWSVGPVIVLDWTTSRLLQNSGKLSADTRFTSACVRLSVYHGGQSSPHDRVTSNVVNSAWYREALAQEVLNKNARSRSNLGGRRGFCAVQHKLVQGNENRLERGLLYSCDEWKLTAASNRRAWDIHWLWARR